MVKIGKTGEEDSAKASGTESEEGVSPETERLEAASNEHESVILMELRKLRQEHAEAASDKTTSEGQTIYFNHDYTTEVQKKR